MPAEAAFEIEVVYAGAAEQWLQRLKVPPGTTAWEAVQRSGLLEQIPSGQADPSRLGLFGRRMPPDTVLAAGDRVELYRALLADPKEARRWRARR